MEPFKEEYLSPDSTWKFNCLIRPQEGAFPRVAIDALVLDVGKQIYVRKPYDQFFTKPIHVQQAINAILERAELYMEGLIT